LFTDYIRNRNSSIRKYQQLLIYQAQLPQVLKLTIAIAILHQIFVVPEFALPEIAIQLVDAVGYGQWNVMETVIRQYWNSNYE